MRHASVLTRKKTRIRSPEGKTQKRSGKCVCLFATSWLDSVPCLIFMGNRLLSVKSLEHST